MEEANSTIENSTSHAPNATGKIPATPEGMLIAYGSLICMALVPIFVGSFRSVKLQATQKETQARTGERPERMTQKDAAMFPIIASGALLSIYIVFKVFGKEHINLLLTAYFFLLGVLALTHLMTSHVSRILPSSVPLLHYHLVLNKGPEAASVDNNTTSTTTTTTTETDTADVSVENVLDFSFSTHDVITLILASLIGLWYMLQKHWIANNVFGVAFCINGVEMLNLNSVLTGCILLGGLFVYDVFWVFGTDVMVTVARMFEAPIKLVFPQDLLEHGWAAKNFAMLGLGDIVIPGIFIALLLRFDNSLQRNGKQLYFSVCFGAYIAGLLATMLVMHVFKHAQPALLYLVPACLGAPLLVALVQGDLHAMFQYEDHPEPIEATECTDKKQD